MNVVVTILIGFAWVVIAIMLVKAVMVILSFLFFLSEKRRKGPLPFTFLEYAKNNLLEILAFWAILPLSLAPLFAGDKKDKTRKGTPILLVHGYCMNAGMWFFIRQQLIKRLPNPLFTITLSPFAPIEKFSKKVAKKARRIVQETGIPELILIGHSQGGLVSAFYTENLAPPASVKQVITIGTPLKGTRLASFGIGPNAKQMRLGSSFLKDLENQITSNTTTHYNHMALYMDNIIVPASSALLGDDSQNAVTIQTAGHLASAFSQRVVDQLVHWLTI